ncbi:MAG: M48 family metallopeptidase [Sneathiella sp.]|nr:M48 family metallopeptidase [Sneathiella sp.]
MIRKSPRARKMRLKIRYPKRVEIVLPRGISIRRALQFAEDEKGWIAGQLSRLPDPISFSPDNVIPYQGEGLVITATNSLRGQICIEGDRLYVPGSDEHIPRRVRDWLKKQAKNQILNRISHWSPQMKVAPGRVTLRDQKTRWGSCSSRGNLNFSWRLILTPPPVLDYVVVHELAHLEHLHHGPEFWALVAAHMPSYSEHQVWLKENGGKLQKYDATI